MRGPGRRPVVRWRFGQDPRRLATVLDRGGVLAVPTESSYGLAVDPLDPSAVEGLFRLKGRERTEALPVVGADVSAFTALGIDRTAPGLRWAERLWPAPLTVVVDLREPIPASAGRSSLAVRVPDHGELRALLAALGRAVTATSANPSGAAPYLDPEPLADWLEREGADAVLVDGGRMPGGPPSTLVAFVEGEPRVLRQGRYRI